MAAQVLVVEPAETIKFNGSFSEVVTSELKLTNPTSDTVAFKVKTTAPRRYAVRPNSGVLNSGETASVSVMRQPFEFDPAEKVRHKFMIQSVKLQPGQTLTTVWTESDPSAFMDTRLRVQFDDVPPPSNRTSVESTEQSVETYEQPVTATVSKTQQSDEAKSSISQEEYYRVTEHNERLSKEIIILKDEGKELRKQVTSCSSDAGQKLPQGLSLLFHEKKNLIVIILLLLISFGVGIYLADNAGDQKPLPTK